MKKFIFWVLFMLFSQVGWSQNNYVDSLVTWLAQHPEHDSMRVMTTHRLSYRLSEINTNRAWQYAKETEILAKKIGFDKGIALANINYAILETGEGNLKNSADYYMKAIKISERINYTRGMSISYNNIGENYLRLKEYASAEQYTLKARELNNNIGEKRGESINYEQLGNIYFAQAKLDKAIETWQKGYQLALSAESDPNLLALYNINFGKYYIELNKVPKAFEYIHRADSLALSRSELYSQIQCAKAFSKGYAKLSQHNKAIDQLKNGVHLSIKLGNKTETCELYDLLSLQYDQVGKPDSGMYYLRLHKQLSDTILSDKNFAHLAFVQTQYETKLKEQENQELKQIQKSQTKKLFEKNLLIFVISLALILALVSIFLFYRSFLQKKINLQLAEERKQSEYNKALAEMEVKSLRAQMNPHFLFNSLNSIRNYIIKNESQLASDYLANFASLMRKILDASQQSSLSVEEEIEMLKLYMDLERLRFSNKFNFVIHLHDNLDISNIQIPTMTIQPFIENAIWHGLLPKESNDGMLSLHFKANTSNQDEVICEVHDNGIGRQASELGKSNLKKHHSKGIKITSDRLTKLASYNLPNPIEFHDLYGDNGESIGTKVIIHLPIL